MRALIQRVSEASVKINGKIKNQIGLGILILLGIEEDDDLSDDDISWLSGKITRLRIFNDNEGVMNIPITEINGDILVISQFTLHASTKKGNRPSYIKAAKPDKAIPIYKKFIHQLESDFDKEILSGEFGAFMEISLINDGPVTIIIDTKSKE